MSRLLLRFNGVLIWCLLAASLALADGQSMPLPDHQSGSLPFVPSGRAFSVVLWVKVEFPPNGDRLAGLLVKSGDGWFNGFRLMAVPDVSGVRYNAAAEIGRPRNPDGPVRLDADDRPFEPGQWVHLALVWNGTAARLYVNGKNAAEKGFAGDYVSAGADRVIVGAAGKNCGISTYPFVADGVKVWDRPLSESEVSALVRESTFEPSSPDLTKALLRIQSGEILSVAELSSLRKKYVTPPFVERMLIVGLVFARLGEGEVAKAERALQRLSAMADTPDARRQLRDVRMRAVDALRARGNHQDAARLLAEDWQKLLDAKAAETPIAGLELAAEYRATGRTDLACRIEKEAAGSDFSGRFPHVREALGRKVEYTAFQQPGADESPFVPAVSYYVGPCGNDAWEGSSARPFATFERARQATRELRRKGWPAGGVAINFKDGTYRIGRTLRLEPEDAGEAGSPLVVRAEEGARPVLSGGYEVGYFQMCGEKGADARIPLSVRSKVRVADVGSIGKNRMRTMPQYGFYVGRNPAVIDLYRNGELLVPARFPNGGWLRTTGYDPERNWISADIGAALRWEREPDLMATGYWRWFWGDLSTRVTAISSSGLSVKLAVDSPSEDAGKVGDVRKGQKFFLYNALCALDTHDEWYLDRASGRLYVMDELANKSVYTLAAFEEPFIRVDGVKHVRIEGLTFEYGQGDAVFVTNSSEIVFAGNVVRNFGGTGLQALSCRKATIADNVFHTFGHGALKVSGGDRLTLSHSEIRICNNDLSDVERRRRTYAPMLHLSGVGAEVSNNHFHEAPSSAIRLEGNDFLIVSNLVENVVKESDDQGGLDIYFNVSYQGNRYLWNVWKDIGRPSPDNLCGQAGVRFDGNISGQTVYGNRFVRCGTGEFGGLQSCGGRLHVIDNNLFVDCNRGMSITDYPLSRWTNQIFRSVAPFAYDPNGIDVRRPPFSSRYPGVAGLQTTNQVNHLVRNIVVGSNPLLVNPPDATVTFANRHFAVMPDLRRLERETSWAHIPEESEVGVKPTRRFLRAKSNDVEWDALGVNPYDYLVLKPKMPRDYYRTDPRCTGDRYNDHFQVIKDDRRNAYFAFWTQASKESDKDHHISFAKSTDGGRTWTPTRILAGSANRVTPRLVASWQQPMLSKSGRLYVLWNQQLSNHHSHYGEMFGICSDDAGETWSAPQRVSWPDNACPPQNPGEPHNWCIWQRPLRLGPDGCFYAAASHYEGVVDFIAYENIDEDPDVKDIRVRFYQTGDARLKAPANPLSDKCEEASIVKLPDGRLFAVLRSQCGHPLWTQSRDQGRSWAPTRILKDENGKPYLHCCSPCPMYDRKGCEAGSGEYFVLIHNTYDFKVEHAWQDRGPLYLVAGRFDPNGEQPVRFGQPKLFAPRVKENSFYSSYTYGDNVGVLWFNDMKYYLLGRMIGARWWK